MYSGLCATENSVNASTAVTILRYQLHLTHSVTDTSIPRPLPLQLMFTVICRLPPDGSRHPLARFVPRTRRSAQIPQDDGLVGIPEPQRARLCEPQRSPPRLRAAAPRPSENEPIVVDDPEQQCAEDVARHCARERDGRQAKDEAQLFGEGARKVQDDVEDRDTDSCARGEGVRVRTQDLDQHKGG